MDCSIIVVAPERARSAAKRSEVLATAGGLQKALSVLHHWISANDDRVTYRICSLLFALAVTLASLEGCHG